MHKLKSKKIIITLLLIVVVLIAGGVIIFGQHCEEIIGDGYYMNLESEPIVIGETCESNWQYLKSLL